MMARKVAVIQNGKILGYVNHNAHKQAAALLGCSPRQEFRVADGRKLWCFTDK